MKSTRAVLAACLSVALGACAGTPPPQDAPAPPPVASAESGAAPTASAPAATARLDPNEMICRRQVTTGSRFAKTRCQTRYQWELEQREARKQTEESQGSVGPPQT